MLQLGNDLPAVWHHPHASHDLKKRILRTVLHEVVIDTDEAHREHVLHLHWQGGVHTQRRAAGRGSATLALAIGGSTARAQGEP